MSNNFHTLTLCIFRVFHVLVEQQHRQPFCLGSNIWPLTNGAPPCLLLNLDRVQLRYAFQFFLRFQGLLLLLFIVIAPEIIIIICYCDYYCYCINKTYCLIWCFMFCLRFSYLSRYFEHLFGKKTLAAEYRWPLLYDFSWYFKDFHIFTICLTFVGEKGACGRV